MRRVATAAFAALLSATAAEAEDRQFTYVVVERFEYLVDPETTVIDMDLVYGGDTRRFIARLEAARPDAGDTEAELKLLYSRPLSAYFDLQFGAALERHDGDTGVGLGIGLEGEAPYRIHTELFAGIDDDGHLAVEAKFERDVWLTSRWALQPRLELGTSDAAHSADLSLRLRFEVTRKFLPYLGVTRQHTAGDGGHFDDTTVVAGASFWF